MTLTTGIGNPLCGRPLEGMDGMIDDVNTKASKVGPVRLGTAPVIGIIILIFLIFQLVLVLSSPPVTRTLHSSTQQR